MFLRPQIINLFELSLNLEIMRPYMTQGVMHDASSVSYYKYCCSERTNNQKNIYEILQEISHMCKRFFIQRSHKKTIQTNDRKILKTPENTSEKFQFQ